MLEIRKAVVDFDEQEVMRLEGIIIDEDASEALTFLRKSVYDKIEKSQRGRLKSHLDGAHDPAGSFKQSQEKP